MFEEQPKKKVKKEVQVKKEMQCYRCDYPIKKNACGGQRPVTCDICHAVYHMECPTVRGSDTSLILLVLPDFCPVFGLDTM